MADGIKKMDLRDFWELGYLQEANRQFFHPLGIALEITLDENDEITLSGVWDYRDDPEGMTFGDDVSEHVAEERIRKRNYVQRQKEKFQRTRMKKLGYHIQSFKEKK